MLIITKWSRAALDAIGFDMAGEGYYVTPAGDNDPVGPDSHGPFASHGEADDMRDELEA